MFSSFEEFLQRSTENIPGDGGDNNVVAAVKVKLDEKKTHVVLPEPCGGRQSLCGASTLLRVQSPSKGCKGDDFENTIGGRTGSQQQHIPEEQLTL